MGQCQPQHLYELRMVEVHILQPFQRHPLAAEGDGAECGQDGFDTADVLQPRFDLFDGFHFEILDF